MSIQLSNRTPLTPIVRFPSAYSEKPRVCGLSFPDVSPFTRQEFKDECDINTLMARYIRTGELPHVNRLAPQYFDADASDFQTHMEAVATAKSLFAQLPSDVRARFYNDPRHFVDFCGDDANRVELAQMGLLSPDVTRSLLNPGTPTAPPTPTRAPAPPSASPSAPAAPEGGA